MDCSEDVIKGLNEPADNVQTYRSFGIGGIIMRTMCVISYIILAVVFAAVILFLPYAVLLFAVAIALAFPCKIFQWSRKEECRLGFC